MATKRKQRVARKADLGMPDLIGNPDAPSFAPGQIRILVATLDFTLLLGELRLDTEGVLNMTEICRIRLSPQHAKALTALLAKNVIDYESEIGPIILPEVVEEDADTKKNG